MFLPVIILTLFWQCCCWGSTLNAADADVLWSRAVSMAKQGQVDLAFSNFRMLVDSYPAFSKSPTAQLDLGEYYFFQNDFSSAIPEFESSYTKYPKQQESLLALAFLYKIAEIKKDKDSMGLYQKKLVSLHPFVLIFRDRKSFEYISGFQHKYKIVFFINKIEVLLNDRPFVEIPC